MDSTISTIAQDIEAHLTADLSGDWGKNYYLTSYNFGATGSQQGLRIDSGSDVDADAPFTTEIAYKCIAGRMFPVTDNQLLRAKNEVGQQLALDIRKSLLKASECIPGISLINGFDWDSLLVPKKNISADTMGINQPTMPTDTPVPDLPPVNLVQASHYCVVVVNFVLTVGQ